MALLFKLVSVIDPPPTCLVWATPGTRLNYLVCDRCITQDGRVSDTAHRGEVHYAMWYITRSIPHRYTSHNVPLHGGAYSTVTHCPHQQHIYESQFI